MSSTAKEEVSSPKESHGTHALPMKSALGPYSMARQGSGTSWQPDATPMEGLHFGADGWALMAHGVANVIYDRQTGPRGDTKFFTESMAMLMGNRPLGPGTLGLRAMVSLDPTMGKSGYPLLFQTGETADGLEHLVDRQHPHDFFMELATSYSVPSTLAYGRNRKTGPDTDTSEPGWLLESTYVLRDAHTFFGRAEEVENSELFGHGDPLHGQAFRIRKFSVGYVHDFARTGPVKWGIGGLVGLLDAPSELDPVYGSSPRSYMVFLQGRL
jgi:hypothetical protein